MVGGFLIVFIGLVFIFFSIFSYLYTILSLFRKKH